ncbi:Hypothetical_protein [Hexamita inflata]|uniref:Hypothetical_protein n=1 Tax=Hexamita inflata TaxID=28002 RepID=A0AA86NUA6_9EUKA|nr:Hypothetical protein HINF_LOCUS12804 [Hexamita inflata]
MRLQEFEVIIEQAQIIKLYESPSIRDRQHIHGFFVDSDVVTKNEWNQDLSENNQLQKIELSHINLFLNYQGTIKKLIVYNIQLVTVNNGTIIEEATRDLKNISNYQVHNFHYIEIYCIFRYVSVI